MSGVCPPPRVTLGRGIGGKDMRAGSVGRRCAGAVCALALAVLTGCGHGPDAADAAPRPAPTTAGPSGRGAVFLAVGACGSAGTGRVAEVPCGGDRAAARVLARHDGREADGPLCPPATDFVLHIDAARATADGRGPAPQGYACMRRLAPPHPGDPGGGGGPRTVVGDCVYRAGGGRVRETACDGRGAEPPEYVVAEAVTDRSACPPATALYVQLGGARPVGCARPR